MSFLNNEISSSARQLSSAMKQRFEAERDSCFKYTLEEYKKTSEYKNYLESEDIMYT